MRRIQKFAAVNVLAVMMCTGIPALAGQDGYGSYNRGGMQHQSGDHRGNREWNDNRGSERGRGGYERGDYERGWREDRGYGYSYAPEPVYQGEPMYNGDEYYGRSHNGRTAAIVGGSAAAGAVIGAAAGHGRGAIIGAVIGGLAGAAASAAADHHDRY